MIYVVVTDPMDIKTHAKSVSNYVADIQRGGFRVTKIERVK